jgi:hypothetical protein
MGVRRTVRRSAGSGGQMRGRDASPMAEMDLGRDNLATGVGPV